MKDDTQTTEQPTQDVKGINDPFAQADKAEAPATTAPPVKEPSDLRQEAERLQTVIRKGMPTTAEMRKGEPWTVRANLDWSRRTSKDVTRYLDIRKKLTNLPSVEQLRVRT